VPRAGKGDLGGVHLRVANQSGWRDKLRKVEVAGKVVRQSLAKGVTGELVFYRPGGGGETG